MKLRISNAAGIFIIFSSILFASAYPCTAAFAGGKENEVMSGNARFTVIAPECIRMEYSDSGEFIDSPSLFAINRDAAFKGFKQTKEGGSTVIDTGVIRLMYTPDGKPFSDANLRATITSDRFTSEWKPGMKSAGNLGGTIRTVDGVRGPVDLGEGVLSRDGWYLLDDSTRHIYTKDWVAQRPKNAGLDWYLFGYGHDYLAGLRAFTTIGGKVPLPRKYTMGTWYSRYWPYSSKDYHQIIDEYKSHDFPLDVIVLDMDWHKDGWTGWSWNRKLLPDAEELLKWFHKQGLAVTLNLHPADGVGPHEDEYAKFMKDMGADPASKESIPFDAGNKKYLDTLFNDVVSPLEKEGVDFWWLDWQQYPFTRSIPDLTNLWWLNQYFTDHTSKGGLRGQSFSRWAGWGDHRHPIHFSGDDDTSWPMLSFIVPLTSTAGNVGTFFWSHDIGGHMGLRNPESYTRWVQFGATSAALRSHSTRSYEMDRRPWKYYKWCENSMRISFHMRSMLFPYIYSSASQSTRNSIPLNRPMYLSYPEDNRAYVSPNQYFYGDALLAAPIVMPGVGKRKVGIQNVWFPEGKWYNWFTGERYEGNTETVVAADIDEFPLYARGGVPIPMQPYTERMSTTPLTDLVVRCYPGEDGKSGAFTLYEDDGTTSDYLKGKFAETALSCTKKGDSVTIKIAPAKGSFDGQPKQRAYIIELPCTTKASGAKIDGKSAKVEFNAEESVNRIKVPKRSISQGVEITVNAPEADYDKLRAAAASRRVKGLVDNASDKKSLRDIIAAYAKSNPDKATLETLLAIGGLSLYTKNESLYLYKGTEKVYLYAAPGLVDGDSISLTVSDQFGLDSKDIYSDRKTVERMVKLDMPSLPEFGANTAFGVSANRILKCDFTVGGTPVSFQSVMQSKDSFLTKWNVIGPFDLKRNEDISARKYEPETKPLDLAGVYKGKQDQAVQWHRAKANEDGVIDLQKQFYVPHDDSIGYAVTFIDSDKAQEVTFKVNSDDGFELWLNGEKLATKNVSRTIDYERDLVKAKLVPGRNTLIIKVSQFYNDWKFKVAVDALYPLKETYGKK